MYNEDIAADCTCKKLFLLRRGGEIARQVPGVSFPRSAASSLCTPTVLQY